MSGTDSESGASASGASRWTTWHQQAFAAVTRWTWLYTLNDRVTAVVQPVYDRYRDNPALELMHGGRWVGHALHPALSDLPIGLWWSAFVLDVLGKDVPANGTRLDPSATLSAAGLVAAAATATTGVADWTVSDGEDRRIGLFHGVLNAGGMTLQGTSLVARLSGRRATARALGAAGLAVTAAAGFVGGHLVQGRAVMVNRVATATGPPRWSRRSPRRTYRTTRRPASRSRADRCCCIGATARCTHWTTGAAMRADCSAGVRSTAARSSVRCTGRCSTCGTVRSCADPRTTRSRYSRPGSATAGSRSEAPSPGPGAREPERNPPWHGKR